MAAHTPRTAHPQPARARRGFSLLLALLLLLPLLAGAGRLAYARLMTGRQTATAMMAANALAGAGQHALAAQAYEQLVRQGYGGRALLYNLGTATLDAGNPARAVEVLREAQAQFPRDTTIRAALAEAEQAAAQAAAQAGAQTGMQVAVQGEQGAAAPPAPSLATHIKTTWIGRDELAALALLLWTGTAALLLAAVRSPRRAVRFLSTAGAVLLGVGLLAALALIGA